MLTHSGTKSWAKVLKEGNLVALIENYMHIVCGHGVYLEFAYALPIVL